ncbi:amino acid/amide ABC transporter membrane protein 1, HAAT family [Roseovarius lutimaris]|uniref:Amino acid/amide ABC transporter membrane protein 1, HAAT family n=1 Tax=Roseovarius lutimaris TaxID=1005928 RepID=A0A1I5GS47_9RHOB|nr:branched-chain amino acid ABC transporter permease [Roseovarius lutimaris]SFO38828.1 amino acid/amide ABC transporter membrane protein 1, HAAT family [Roseovarius lutimaris]
MNELIYAIELTITGLLIGSMYSLVALGFVLIFKASSVFNFAQGAMTLFAALSVVGLFPIVGFWPALALTIVAMCGVAVFAERVIFRPLIGGAPLVIFMATLGLAFMLEGSAQIIWGTQPYGLDLGIPIEPIIIGGVYISRFDLVAAGVAGLLVLLLVLFFQKTKIGLGLRAVADDHVAAQSMGIQLRRVWAVAWALAGLVALAAGMLWGARIGVHFAMSLIALKALPVLIIGGIESVPGAIVGGLIVGVAEALGEGFVGSMIGGGVQDIMAYLVALLFLLFRPYGLFGEKKIERV